MREIRTRRKRGTPVEHPPTLIIQRALHTQRERERERGGGDQGRDLLLQAKKNDVKELLSQASL